MPPLNSAPISSHEAERRLQELLYEFLQRYFTGAPVQVGANQRTFPLLSKNTEALTPWLFGDMELRGNPAAWVHTLITDWRPREDDDSDTQKLVTGDVTLNIYTRAANPGTGLQQPDFLSRSIADGIRQIIESEQIELARKDLHDVRVRRGPVPVAYPGAQSRMLIVSARPMYRVAY